MFYFKSILRSFILFIFIILFSGCIHKIDKQGLTLNISQEQITDSFNDSFPLVEDFVFGNIQINSPKIDISEEKQRVYSLISFKVSTIVTKTQHGYFKISGYPFYNKKEKAIYLQDVKIEELHFSTLSPRGNFLDTFKSAIEPVVNQAFKKFPIYKIEKDSFQGTFVKNIKIGDQALLVTFGI